MSTEITLEDKRSAALERVPTDNALMALIEKLSSNESLDVAKAEKLVELYISGQRRMQEMQDERTYYERMAEFKRDPPEVVKRLTAKIKGQSRSGKDYQFDVPYADLHAFSEAAMADLANRGITWDYEIVETPKSMSVTCLLHYGLYTRRGSPATGDPELLQSPNPFMQKGAAQSFLMRYSFCASTGLTAALPDDKNGTTLTPRAAEEFFLEEGVAADFMSLIDGSGTIDELWENYERACMAAGVEKGKDGKLIPGTEKDPASLDQFTKARRRRAAQLEGKKNA